MAKHKQNTLGIAGQKHTSEPKVWFHEVFENNGEPYKIEEVNFIKEITQSEN